MRYIVEEGVPRRWFGHGLCQESVPSGASCTPPFFSVEISSSSFTISSKKMLIFFILGRNEMDIRVRRLKLRARDLSIPSYSSSEYAQKYPSFVFPMRLLPAAFLLFESDLLI
jgi:hypothetical protein